MTIGSKPRVTGNELKKATAMAGRKSGVTRQQLVDKLEIRPARAISIFDKLILTGVVDVNERGGGGPTGRTLIYTAKGATNGTCAPTKKAPTKKKVTKKAPTKKKAAKKKRVKRVRSGTAA